MTDEPLVKASTFRWISPLEAVKHAQERWETAQRQEREARASLEQAVREARKTMTLAVIAQELGVSRERVRQMSTKEGQ